MFYSMVPPSTSMSTLYCETGIVKMLTLKGPCSFWNKIYKGWGMNIDT